MTWCCIYRACGFLQVAGWDVPNVGWLFHSVYFYLVPRISLNSHGVSSKYRANLVEISGPPQKCPIGQANRRQFANYGKLLIPTEFLAKRQTHSTLPSPIRINQRWPASTVTVVPLLIARCTKKTAYVSLVFHTFHAVRWQSLKSPVHFRFVPYGSVPPAYFASDNSTQQTGFG